MTTVRGAVAYMHGPSWVPMQRLAAYAYPGFYDGGGSQRVGQEFSKRGSSQGSLGRKSPSGVRGKASVRGLR